MWCRAQKNVDSRGFRGGIGRYNELEGGDDYYHDSDSGDDFSRNVGALDSPEDTDTTDDDVDVDKHESDSEPEEAPIHYSEVTGEGIDFEEDPEANEEAHTHTREGVQESGNISNADEVEVSASVECNGEGEDISSSSSRQGRATLSY